MKAIRYKKVAVLWCLVLPAWRPIPAGAQQEVVLRIYSKEFQPVFISIDPFQSANHEEQTRKIRDIAKHDLISSGFIKVVEPDTGAGAFSTALNSGGDLPGSRISANLKAAAVYRRQSVELTVRLYQVPDSTLIFEKTFDSDLDRHRRLAHRAADEILFYLVGERGVADTRIAYVSQNQAGKEIAMMDADGHASETLTASGSINLSPCWSPDGGRIAFTSYVSGNPDLLILNIDKNKAVKLNKGTGLHSAPAWSPDGKKIALTMSRNGNADIYTIEIASGKMQRLTSGSAIDSSPTWSPDGRRLAFTSDRSGNPQVYVMDASGGDVRRLSYEGNYNDSPAWSPRGDLIAYVSREIHGFQIYTIDVNGENIRRITDGRGNNENPSWAPDGLHLVFASDRTGQWDLYSMNWDGTNLRRLTSNGGNISPEWSPRLGGE